MVRLCLLAILAFACTACDRPQVYAVAQEQTWSPSVFHEATANKQVRTVVAGNPFLEPDKAVRTAVIAAMQPANWHFREAFTPRTAFVDTPTGPTDPRYHVAVALDPADPGSLADFCRLDRPPPTLDRSAAATGEAVDARMVFCRDGTPLVTSVGRVDAVKDVADPRFHAMISRMAMELYPQRRDDRECRSALSRTRC